MTPAALLGDELVNTTVAILAYHYLSDNYYTEVRAEPPDLLQSLVARCSDIAGARLT